MGAMVRPITLLLTVLYFATALNGQAPILSQESSELESAVSVRVMFGLKKLTPMRWDGKISVGQGRVLRVDGVHFEGRDEIQGNDSWLLTTRVTRYADSSMPRGYDPVHTRPFAMVPNGVVAMLAADDNALVTVETVSGDFTFRLVQIPLGKRMIFLDEEVSVERIPNTVDLTAGSRFNDYPGLAFQADGVMWTSWISYANREDAVFAAQRRGTGWETPIRVSPPGYVDNFRSAAAVDGQGRLWVIWSGKRDGRWGLFARSRSRSAWSEVTTLGGGQGENLYHAAVADSGGRVHVAWQGFREGVSKILHRRLDGGSWSAERVVSSGEADNWTPALDADSKGAAWVGWDGYEAGDFNVYLRKVDADGSLGNVVQVTRSQTFDANVSLACDSQDRVWIAWDHGEANWGKDWSSQRFKPGGGAGLYRTRNVRVAVWDGKAIQQPNQPIMDAVPSEYKDYFQQARLVVDSNDGVWAMGRSLTSATTRVNNNWGAGGRWEAVFTRLDQNGWTSASTISRSGGRNDVWAQGARGPNGKVWFTWARDGRAFGGPTPINRPSPKAGVTQLSYTSIDPSTPGWKAAGPPRLEPFSENVVEATPVHPNDTADVAAIRGYRYETPQGNLRILRGDLHRHTDISADGIGDGSLKDFYRYAFTAGQYDFMMVGDHQYGGNSDGLEYNWWRTEKSEDIYLAANRFWPMFGTERSLSYPNGHRNTVFATRGIRELPIAAGERRGEINTGSLLYPYLRRNGGIATSHTSSTDQGTDWRDSDEEVEPIVEIYQGLHASYEYVGAPRAETPDKQYYHHGDTWRPKGFVWEAWAKGIKLGVQASADHIATHDAYACVLVEDRANITRQDLLDAMKKRHTYAATDNIIVDVRIGDHVMGDAFRSSDRPVVRVRAIGTQPLAKIVLIKNNQFTYTTEPGTKEANFEFSDSEAEEGESYYYVRVEQSDGSLAWSSPIWVDYRP